MIELGCVNEQMKWRHAPILTGQIKHLLLVLLHNNHTRKFK